MEDCIYSDCCVYDEGSCKFCRFYKVRSVKEYNQLLKEAVEEYWEMIKEYNDDVDIM